MLQDTALTPASLTCLPEVRAYLKKRPSASYREIAEKLNITTASVKKCIAAGKLKYNIKLKPPRLSLDNTVRRSMAAGLIWHHMDPSGGNKVLVMDKVSYISANLRSNHYHTGIWALRGHPPSKAYWNMWEQTKDPRPDYYLVWQAMTSDGLVSPFVIMINKFDTKEYVEECLRKVMLPWLEQNYNLENVLHWPDLCPSHNSSKVHKFLDANKISYVKKCDNAPKLTHARPIEFCLAKCKEEYTTQAYREREAEDLDDFRKIYAKINEEVMNKYAKEMCAEIPENLLAIEGGYM